MPRPNYGNAVKQRAVQFFTVLVDYANDELDIDDRQLESLQRDIQLHWQTSKRCVVRTKVRYLEQLTKLAGAILTGEQIKESIKCLTDFLEIIEDNRASKGGSETWHFSLNLWHERIDRAANLDRFIVEWNRRKSTSNSIEPQSGATTDYWWELVRSSLTAQQYHRITTNPLMGEERLKFSLEEVYVPLNLVERSRATMFEVQGENDRSGAEFEADANGDLDIDRLLAGLVTNPEPNRIAIIGEPGAGKTTCLQKLAAGLLERQLLPIWISLADLQGEKLEDYLLQDWLKLATRQIAIDTKLQQDFAAQFDRGSVWLLLDAVDEMAIPQWGGSANDASIALARIELQLRGWIGSAHVILTCRSNVWDSGKNALENFTTYRNLSLSNGYHGSIDRVKQFIQGWFRTQPELGDRLRTELSQPQYQRLRDAIKNPLRLALLCRYWLLTQGKLPSTKASLYQQFTDTIYAWKQDRFPTSLSQRQQLNAALGNLALQEIGLDSPNETKERVRFRLHEHNILALINPDLLELALQLGWLNQVGISASTGAKIYAFYHSTFQEYFAARSINDWQYFLTGTFTSHAPIFSPYWQETILFWFGRGDIPASEKEAFIASLINFDRSHGGFHYYRAYFLAAAALAEFPESIYTQQIIDRLLQWRFAKFVPEQNNWKFYPLPIQDGARVALRQTDRSAAISGLEKLVQTVKNPFVCWQAAHSLGKVFDPGNAIAIQALVNSLALVNNNDLLLKICESLSKIDPNSEEIVIETLVNTIHAGKTITITRKAAFLLGKILIESARIDPDRSLFALAIATLVRIVESSDDTPEETLRHRANQLAALENLRQIDPTHPAAQRQFTSDRTLPSSNRKRRKKVADPRNIEIAIGQLEQKLATITNAESQRRYAYQLGRFQPGHPLAVNTLLQLISSPQSKSFYKLTGEYLQEIALPSQLPAIVTQLKNQAIAVEQGDRSTATLICYKLLWYCAEQLPDRLFIEIWHR